VSLIFSVWSAWTYFSGFIQAVYRAPQAGRRA
jgi:hypothetical protein